MKAFHFISLLLSCISFSFSQPPLVKGSVVLRNNQVLVGELSKEPIHELVLMRCSDGMKVLPAHQVAYYRFYDSEHNINRQFLSVTTNDLFGTSKFFEIMIQGTVKVLRRYHKKTPEDALDEAYDFDYFVWLDNTLIPLVKFKRKIYPALMQKYPLEMEAFVSIHQLHLTSIPSAFSIIKHFNSLDRKLNVLAHAD